MAYGGYKATTKPKAKAPKKKKKTKKTTMKGKKSK
jgi:hypothetical protein|tara:strand:+ start:26 stop:130 length:105 start_codon:yes stop_codon:yes gene_type:complete